MKILGHHRVFIVGAASKVLFSPLCASRKLFEELSLRGCSVDNQMALTNQLRRNKDNIF